MLRVSWMAVPPEFFPALLPARLSNKPVGRALPARASAVWRENVDTLAARTKTPGALLESFLVCPFPDLATCGHYVFSACQEMHAGLQEMRGVSRSGRAGY